MEGNVTTPDPSVSKSSDHEPNCVHKIVLHVLSPSLDAPNRITFEELPVALTVAELKARITQAMPTKPHASQQRLIYRGKPLLNDSMVLQQILDPPDALVHTLHLVLPPRPHLAETPIAPAETGDRVGPGVQPNGITETTQPTAPAITQQSQGLRFRGLPPPEAFRGAIEPHFAALRRDFENIRRSAAHFHARPTQPVQRSGEAPPVSDHWHRQPPSTIPAAGNAARMIPATRVDGEQTSASNVNGVSSSVPTPTGSIVSSLQSLDYETRRLRLFTLQHQIVAFELQLARGAAPPLDEMIAVRNQINEILDEQHRNLAVIRDNFAEMLLTRITNIYVRADQIRQIQFRSIPQRQHANPFSHINLASPGGQAPMYILSSPSGYQALVTGTGEQIGQSANGTLIGNVRGQNPAPAQVGMENIVRQAIINQAAVNQNQQNDVFGRNARRLWLFIRLYFFCYLFSDSGSWTRAIFITFALVISFLSETGLPTRFYQAVLDPVQRHLEGLIHAGGDDAVEYPTANGTDANTQSPNTFSANDGTRRPQVSRMQQNIRRVERSLALFIASLIPGVGERHVEVRNARNARNAELRREEAERRRTADAANQVTDAPAEATPTANEQDGEIGGPE